MVAVTWLGAHLAVHHGLSAGELIAFYASAAFLVLPMQTFVEAASLWTSAVVAARRIIGVLALEPRIAGNERAVPATPRGTLLDETTGTRIEAGRLTAVVPSAPEEGTALLERLGRWVGRNEEPSRVLWGDHDVGTLPLQWYREHVVMLERSPFHLKGSLHDALNLGVSGSEATRRVVEVSQADEIIDGLSHGFDEELPERWRSLSGGQRQRLSLAQVLALSPDVLLLDDPTSAVDAHTEAAIVRALAAERRGRTTVICTTSPLVCEVADEVVLLTRTAIARGSHVALLAGEPRYEAVILRGGVA